MNYLLIGWKYFLMRNTVSAVVTLILTGYALFGPVLLGTLYYLSDKVTIQKAVPSIPATPTSGDAVSRSGFILVQSAARPQRGPNEIWLPNKKTGVLEFYGSDNVTYQSFVIQGGKYDGWILVWDTRDREGVWIKSDFRDHIQQQLKQR